MTKLRKMGLLGGMGPLATVRLMELIIERTKADDDADHIPLLVEMNPQVPSRIDALLNGNGADPGPVLAEMAKRLSSMGVEGLAMPCNTAHLYADHIQNSVSIPFLNMISLTAEAIRECVGVGGRIGMLASPATEVCDVFRPTFKSFELEVSYPVRAERVLSIIQDIKANGVTEEHAARVSRIGEELHRLGADCLLVGCSELSLLTKDLKSDIPVFDSLEILADAVISFSGGRLRTPTNRAQFALMKELS